MKKLTLIAALLISLPAVAQAQTYIELRGGGAWLDDTEAFDPGTFGVPIIDAEVSLDGGWVGALAIGIDRDGGLRYELEYSHREYDVSVFSGLDVSGPPVSFSATPSGQIVTDAVLAIGYVDIEFDSAPRLTPYLGFGAGVAISETEVDGVSNSETLLALTMRAGVAFSVAQSIDLTAGASLFFADQDFPLGGDIDQIGHTFTAGIRYSF